MGEVRMSQDWRPVIDRASRRQNHLQRLARETYAIFCSGFIRPLPAWEQLNNVQQAAWKAVVEFLLDDAECLQCGEPLLCVNCTREEV
jgi:hypothetical protein